MKIETYEKYKKVIADDGHVITAYKDGDESYTYCITMIMPLNADVSPYREITIEEHNRLEEKYNKINILH